MNCKDFTLIVIKIRITYFEFLQGFDLVYLLESMKSEYRPDYLVIKIQLESTSS